jgi:hypothetical protein
MLEFVSQISLFPPFLRDRTAQLYTKNKQWRELQQRMVAGVHATTSSGNNQKRSYSLCLKKNVILEILGQIIKVVKWPQLPIFICHIRC